MIKIAVDLLPLEYRQQNLENAKFYKIQKIGITVILLMFFVSSITFTLGILQSQNIQIIQKGIAASEAKITELKGREQSLNLLKNRLTVIDQNLGVPSSQTQSYQLVTNLLPKEVSLVSISVNKSAEVLAQVSVPDVETLEKLIGNLTSRETNEDKISHLSLENIQRGRDGIYRLSLKIKMI